MPGSTGQRRGSPVSVTAPCRRAVVRAVARDDLVAAGDIRASLIAFSFASAPPFVKNETERSPGRHLGEQAPELRARLVRHRRADRAELVGLLLDRRDDLRVLVADVDVDELRREVEVALAVVVPEVPALGARDRDRVDRVSAPTTSRGRTPSRRRRSARRGSGRSRRRPCPLLRSRALSRSIVAPHDRCAVGVALGGRSTTHLRARLVSARRGAGAPARMPLARRTARRRARRPRSPFSTRTLPRRRTTSGDPVTSVPSYRL